MQTTKVVSTEPASAGSVHHNTDVSCCFHLDLALSFQLIITLTITVAQKAHIVVKKARPTSLMSRTTRRHSGAAPIHRFPPSPTYQP